MDKKSYKNIGIYNTKYITIKKIDHCKTIYSVNFLYLVTAMQMDILSATPLKKKVQINIWFLTLQMKLMSY